MDSRYLTAAVGLTLGLLVSVLAWWYFQTLLVFLLLPFVPFLFLDRDDRTDRVCPRCDFRTAAEEYEYCPRDGERLQEEY